MVSRMCNNCFLYVIIIGSIYERVTSTNLIHSCKVSKTSETNRTPLTSHDPFGSIAHPMSITPHVPFGPIGDHMSSTPHDPFGSTGDPMSSTQHDPFGSGDPISSTQHDPFGSGDPMSSTPNDPFGPKTAVKCCSCREDCIYKGDCCLDKYSEEYSGKNYIDYFLGRTKIRNLFRYIKIINKSIFPSVFLSRRYMIAKCDNTSSKYYKTCNDIYDVTDYPVYDEKGVLYRNYQCAKCHNNSVIHRNVNLKIECLQMFDRDSPSNFSLGKMKDCSLDVKLSEKYDLLHFDPSIRNQVFAQIERVSCDPKDLLLCESYLAVVADQYGNAYANEHCALCYNNHEKNLTTNRCQENYLQYARTGHLGHFQFSFSLMMSQSTDGMVTDICKSGFVFDLSRGECVVPTCNTGYIKMNGSCSKLGRVDNSKFEINLSMNQSSIELKEYCVKENTRYVKIKVSEKFDSKRYPYFRIKPKNISNTTTETISYLLMKQKSQSQSHFLRILDDFGRDKAVKEITYYTSDNLHPDQYIDYNHMFTDKKQCILPLIYDVFNMSKRCNPVINGSEYILMKNATLWMVQKNENFLFHALICSSFYLQSKCAREFYPNHKYLMNKSSKIVTINKEEYTPDQYYPTANGIEICLSSEIVNMYHLPFEGTIWYVESIVSVSFLIISLFGELITIIIFGVIRDLQNTPGRIIMSIAITAFINDILVTYMAFSELTEEICGILAIVLHWFSVALSTWSLCFSFDSWKAMRKTFQVRKSGKKCFMLYIIGVISISSFVLAVASLFQSLTNFDISYGKASEGLCWIRSKYARIVFYIVPTYIMLVLSAALLIFTITQVKKNSFPGMRVTSDSSRMANALNLKILALKLAFALGIIELLSLIEIKRINHASAIANHFVSISNNLIRSLRGTIVMVIFVFSKAVRGKIWKQKGNMKVKSKQEEENTGSS